MAHHNGTATRGDEVQRLELLQLKQIARRRWPRKADNRQAHNVTSISASRINSRSVKDRKWHKAQEYLNKTQSKGRGGTAEGTARKRWPLSPLLLVLLVCVCAWACLLVVVCVQYFLRIQSEIIEEFCHFGSIGSLRADAPLLILEEFHLQMLIEHTNLMISI